MELLVKETVTLHKVLTKYLATPTVEVRHSASGHESACLTVTHRDIDSTLHRPGVRSW